MDTISWIAVIGMMNILVGLVWFLQVKDARNKQDTGGRNAD